MQNHWGDSPIIPFNHEYSTVTCAGCCCCNGLVMAIWTKARIGLIAFALLASSPLGALDLKLKFKSMKLPPDTSVRVEGSTATISGGGIETSWNCVRSEERRVGK